MGTFVQKVEAPANGQGRPGAAGADTLASQFPALVEYLTLATWPDGTARETATLLLLSEDGLWKACLNDRGNERSGWLSGSTLGGLLGSLEAHLAEDRMEWRRHRPGGKYRPRR